MNALIPPQVRTYLPDRVKIEIKRLKDDKFEVHYVERLGEAPTESIENTIQLAEELGVKVKRRGKTIFYRIVGDSSAAFGVILGEALVLSKFGSLSLRELLALAGVGLGQLRKIKEVTIPLPKKKEES